MSEQARLDALRRYSMLDTLPEQGYDDITVLASIICGTPVSLVTLVDAERQWFKSAHGTGIRETPRSLSFCAHTIPTGRMLIVEDATRDPRFAENPLVLGAPNVRFYAGAPIVAPSGHVLGTVCVIDTKPRRLTLEQTAALEALARQVMALFELRFTIEANARAAEALRTAEKIAAVSRLASAIAHEINNPLQSMTNPLFMAESSTELVDQREFLKQSQEELARVSQIVTQTLRFHRQSDKPAPVFLREIVSSVLLLFRTRLGHACVDVQVKDHQTVPLVCYGSDIRQVVANLVGNALDVLNEEPIESVDPEILIRIRDAVSPSTGRAGVRLTLADSGAGMTEETKTRLFEPFYSTKGARGTGLGLWVSKGILDKHEATMQLRSRPGLGTTWSIFLPSPV